MLAKPAKGEEPSAAATDIYFKYKYIKLRLIIIALMGYAWVEGDRSW